MPGVYPQPRWEAPGWTADPATRLGANNRPGRRSSGLWLGGLDPDCGPRRCRRTQALAEAENEQGPQGALKARGPQHIRCPPRPPGSRGHATNIMKCYANHWGCGLLGVGGQPAGTEVPMRAWTQRRMQRPRCSVFSVRSQALRAPARRGRVGRRWASPGRQFPWGGRGGRWASERSLEPLSHLGSQVQGP